MSPQWILCIAFWASFGSGVGEMCRGHLNLLMRDQITIIQTNVMTMEIQVPRNKTETSFCELSVHHLAHICEGFNKMNWTWPALFDIACVRPGYALHVSEPLETLLHCSGQLIRNIRIRNCSISWWDITQLTRFTDPRVIFLEDVSLKDRSNISEMSTSLNSTFHVGTKGIIFESTTSYQFPRSTASYVMLDDQGQYLVNSCILCQMKNTQDAVQYQEYIRNFPYQEFTNLRMVMFSDINMTTVSDLQGFGEISSLVVINCGLKSFPVWRVAKRLLRMDLSLFESTESDALNRLQDIANVHPPDSPVRYKDNALQNTLFERLNKQYVLHTIDFSINPIREISYFDGIERLHYMKLLLNDLHGSRISNLSLATQLFWLDLSYNHLEYLPEHLFANLTQLEYLYLEYCHLSSLDSVLNQNLKSLTSLSLKGNLFHYVAQGVLFLPSLLSLDVTLNNISDLIIPQKTPTSLILLISLTANQLRTFPANLLTTSFPSMGDIELWGNEVTSEGMVPMIQLHQDRVRSGERGVITLLFNCIEYIPLAGQLEVETLDRVLDSFTLYLHHNPLHCGCEEMIAWLQSKGVRNIFAIKCSRESMWLVSKKEKELLSLFPMSRCDKYVRGPYPYQCKADIYKAKVVKVTIATILGLTAFIILILLLKRQSFYMQQWLFILTGLRLYRRGWQHNPFKYDAFVCYCGDDYRWVFQTLLPGLEEDCDPSYSLCVHDRDFIPGQDIADNVMNAMEASRAVILVLSPNSAQSEWCGFEINAAIEERILGSKPLPIIPIILDHVHLQAFTRKQRRMLKKIPSMLAADRNLIVKLRFLLGNPLTIQEDNCGPGQGAGVEVQEVSV